MSRVLKKKECKNTRLANNYGGWIYCTACENNIGYLCYVTYDKFQLNYECNCGSKGSCFLEFEDTTASTPTDEELITIKNRLCCPHDESALVTIQSKKLKNYEFEIVCKECHQCFKKEA